MAITFSSIGEFWATAIVHVTTTREATATITLRVGALIAGAYKRVIAFSFPILKNSATAGCERKRRCFHLPLGGPEGSERTKTIIECPYTTHKWQI
jgi:hypothetical protein